MIIPILSGIFIAAFVAFMVGIKEVNREKAKLKEQEERLNSVIPGAILYKKDSSGNPFADEFNSSIKVLDVKRNSEGEIWIKYAYEDIMRQGLYFEQSPSYAKLKEKLNLYPIIKFPKIKL